MFEFILHVLLSSVVSFVCRDRLLQLETAFEKILQGS